MSTITAERKTEIEGLMDMRQKLRAELPALRRELIIKAAEVQAFARALSDGVMAQFFFLQTAEDHRLFEQKFQEFTEKMSGPTHRELEKTVSERWNELNRLSVEKIAEKLMEDAKASRPEAKVA